MVAVGGADFLGALENVRLPLVMVGGQGAGGAVLIDLTNLYAVLAALPRGWELARADAKLETKFLRIKCQSFE